MVALNRHRLKHFIKQGLLGARTTQRLLARTDHLLSFLLIGNSLINTVISVLATSIALRAFGAHSSILALATAGIALLIIVFSEITPKIVGAAYPEKIALPVSLVLDPLIRATRPLVGFLNLFASGLLRLLRIDTRHARTHRLSIDELRMLVLEESHFLPYQHRSILLNLFDLEHTSVDDVMTPRTRIEALDVNVPLEQLLQQLDKCEHHALPVYKGDIDHLLGILEVRKTFPARHTGRFKHDMLRALLTEPYFVPSGTPVFQQLRSFQEKPHNMALVVDEYGEVQGLITPQDIIEELTGEFASALPHLHGARLQWDRRGECIIPGSMPLRELNRALSLQLPVRGPKTLNGLILEALHEIPEGKICLKIGDCRMLVMYTENQAIQTVKLFQSPTLAE